MFFFFELKNIVHKKQTNDFPVYFNIESRQPINLLPNA